MALWNTVLNMVLYSGYPSDKAEVTGNYLRAVALSVCRKRGGAGDNRKGLTLEEYLEQ